MIRIHAACGLIDYYKKEKGEKGQARVENLEELVSAAKQFVSEEGELSPLQQFLDRAALDAGDAQADEHEDSVQLMTLHSAKGLEFPLVFLAGMEENLFPHRMSMEEPGRLEEERRLCYVGITRAMEKLVITYAECRACTVVKHSIRRRVLSGKFPRSCCRRCACTVRSRSLLAVSPRPRCRIPSCLWGSGYIIRSSVRASC